MTILANAAPPLAVKDPGRQGLGRPSFLMTAVFLMIVAGVVRDMDLASLAEPGQDGAVSSKVYTDWHGNVARSTSQVSLPARVSGD